MTRNSGLMFGVVVSLGVMFAAVAGAVPSLLSLSPDYGSGAGGTVVTMQGSGLSVTGITRVLFGDADATEVLVSDAGPGNFSLTCKTPPHWSGLCNVTVINPDLSTAMLTDAYVFVPTTFDPAVTGALPCFSPTSGGKTIFVLGQEAGLPFNLYTLTIGDAPITGVREYRVPDCIPLYSGIAPAQPQGLVGFGVVGYGNLLPDCFIYSDHTGPLILSCSPWRDWDLGGTEVHIIAGNLPLTGTPAVAFGGAEATNVVVHPDFGGYITCTAPPHAAGLIDVVVTNPDGQSGTLSGAFTYDSTQTPVPVSISPNEGPGYNNYWVTITGSGFSPTGGTTQVAFGGVPASNVLVGGDTTLTCYTPVHEAGTVDIVVTNPGGKSGTLVNGYTFLPPVTPVPASITPNSGQEAGGTMVTITGTDFMSNVGAIQVSFGGVQVYYVHIEEDGDGTQRLSCLTPGHAPGPVDVVVINPGNASATLAGAFTYVSQSPPNPVSVTPGEGSTLGGTRVTISGAGFTPFQSMRVTFGGVQINDAQALDDRTLVCTTPVHSASPVDVVVIASDDSTGVLTGGFTYEDAPPPRIDSVTRPLDLTTGGAQVMIAGAGFSTVNSYPQSTRVFFGGVEAFAVSVMGESSIQCQTPVHPAGVVDVEIVNPDGKTATLSGGFTYVDAPPPHPLTLSPSHGLTLGGVTVAIGGTDFGFNYYAPVRVLFGGVESPSVSVYDTTSLQCKTPPHAPGAVDVVVVNPDGKIGVIPGGFTYLSTMNPTLSSISPGIGFATGGSSVTIQGTDLSETGTTRVTFGGVEATDVRVYNISDGTFQVHCTAPPHTPGTVDVTVHNPGGGEATMAGAYLYILGPPPAVQKLAPDVGGAAGGTPVILTGFFFGTVGTMRVTFGGAEATGVRLVADDTLLCIAPPHEAGAVDVTVINTDGQTGTQPHAFTYRGPANTIVRVDADNLSGTEDGTSWETAFPSIQTGIDAVTATGEPGEVWVAEGNYVTTGNAVVALAPFCDVYGGFAGAETSRAERDIKAHVCTIDGEDAHACVYGADNARLDGFVITRGNGPARSGADGTLGVCLYQFGYYPDSAHVLAIDNSGVSPTLANCIITGNSAAFAAMVNLNEFSQFSCPLIAGCTVTDNADHAYAIVNAVCFEALSLARISNCSFSGNHAGVMNLGLNGGRCAPEIRECSFSANTYAGALVASVQSTCRVRMENCLFAGHKNRVLEVDAGYPGVLSVDVSNCTFADNPTKKDIIYNGYGAYFGYGQTNLTNCIAWGNGGVLATLDPYVYASYSDVEGGYAGTGNMDTDPLFANAAAGNYQLQPGSPCVDTGTAADAPAVDLLGVPRPQRAGFDMGAYELPNPVPAPDVVGQTREVASEALAGAGFALGTVGYQYSLTIPADVVVEQTPAAGADVQPGSAIDLVLSRGGLAVPDVVGKPQPAAAALLQNAMLTVGTVTEQYSATVPVGAVMEQQPAAGAFVLPGTAVDLTVSRGVQPSFMPDVLGQPRPQAELVLAEAGLVTGSVVGNYSDTVPAGGVVSQSPAPGTELPWGTAVSIVVSLGPAPVPEVEPAEGEGEPLNADELRQQLAAVLCSADANANGRLSFDEAVAAVPELTEALFDALDKDGDGQLAPGELDDAIGCGGCQGRKGSLYTADFGRRLGELFLTGLGFLGLAALSAVRRP